MTANQNTCDRPVESNRSPYRLAADVVLVAVPDGSSRLLDMHGEFFALSAIATQMLRGILDSGPTAAAESVATRYATDVQRVRTDLDAFCANLSRQGLLVQADQPERRMPMFRRLIAAALFVLIRLMCFVRPSFKGKAGGLLNLAMLSSRWLGWADTVRLWERLFPRPEHALQGQAAEEARCAIDAAVRQAVAEGALAHACKERGLTAWALARRSGLNARLVIGLCLCPVHGHCWAQIGDTLLADDEDRCGQYEPVLGYE